ncbi:putative drug resistance transporter [Gordonia effusa NBRC 100432]|uniref:Putative drug resistance transporter n=1 Tax=Gordonia effusa NBRC 100432 TaxID=1077974 RepID=H0QUY7_9ACTN|nr:MFS transporter [Gordonia effusa]GAB16638.1 putative drug resistance transporter [Gordonia effusa NBRC 100432]
MTQARSPWIAMVALCLPMLIVSMDVSVLFFAAPFIADDLQATPEQQLWIFDVYGFVLAGLLLTMGSLADRIGHRRLLMIGAVAFSAASLCAAFAVSAEMLIAARALLAVGGATLMPSTLALIKFVFDDPAARAKAVAIWSAVLTGGVALGPIISGLLLEHFWWGSVFLINVPVMVALLVVAPMLLPNNTSDSNRRVDVVSALLALGAILPLIEGIKKLAADGWSVSWIGLIVAGIVVGAVFVWRQRHLAQPLVDLTMFRDRRFSASIWINVIGMFAILGNAIIMTQYLQSVLGYTPLVAALWSLVPSIFVGAAAPAAATAAVRFGRPSVIVMGLLCAAAGFVVLATLTTTDSLISVLIGATLLAAGTVALASVIADYVVGVSPADRAGATSSLLETSSEFGGALGIAVLGSVVNVVFRLSFDDPTFSGTPAGQSLSGAIGAAHELPAGQAQALIAAAREAFVSGLSAAAWVGAGVLVVTAVIAAWALRSSTTGVGVASTRNVGVDKFPGESDPSHVEQTERSF